MATSRTGTGKWRRLRAQALSTAQANNLTHCPHCNQWLDYTTPYTPASAEADHITPYSKGGQDTPDNIQIICRACNLTKSGGRTKRATPTPLTPETLITW